MLTPPGGRRGSTLVGWAFLPVGLEPEPEAFAPDVAAAEAVPELEAGEAVLEAVEGVDLAAADFVAAAEPRQHVNTCSKTIVRYLFGEETYHLMNYLVFSRSCLRDRVTMVAMAMLM